MKLYKDILRLKGYDINNAISYIDYLQSLDNNQFNKWKIKKEKFYS